MDYRNSRYSIHDKVKIRLPPTHEMMLSTGRRSSHLASWRGPCTITSRLSSTAYSMIEDSTQRKFERVVSNILPYRAVSARSAAAFDPTYSDPFSIQEYIAIRDEPGQPFYIAAVTAITAVGITVHYLGSTQVDLAKAVFRLCWHKRNSNDVVLSVDQPANHVPYSGILEFDALRNLLVARTLEFTSSMRLRARSRRTIAPMHDELFIFDR